MPRADTHRRSIAEIAIISVVWALVVAIVNPRGNFPLNDDWNFAWATWHFVDHGEFQFSRLTGMSLRAQVLYGAAWTLLFGKSFEVLRASMLLLALLSAILVHRTLHLAGAGSAARVIGATALAVHPIFFWASFTFMTHVSFVCVSVAAFYCHLRGIRDRRMGWMIAGAGFVAVSYFIRQTGVANAVPAVIAAYLVYRTDWRGTLRWSLPAIVSGAVFASLYLFTDLLAGYPGQLSVHYEAWGGGSASSKIATALEFAARYTSYNLQYSGLFFLPLLPAAWTRIREYRSARLSLFATIPLATWAASAHLGMDQLMPYRKAGNVLSNFALGPLTLRDTWIFEYQYPTHLNPTGQFLLTAMAVAGGIMIGAAAISVALESVRGSSTRDVALGMAAGHMLVATALLWISGIYFDRYSLDSMWALAILLPLSMSWSRIATTVSASFAAIVLLLSVAGVSEYLEWNRARWQAYHHLTARGIGLEQMDGGYEINQYLLGGQHGEIHLSAAGMSVVDDRYILTFNPVRGYRTVARYPYRRLGRDDGTLFVQERTTGFRPHFTDDDLED